MQNSDRNIEKNVKIIHKEIKKHWWGVKHKKIKMVKPIKLLKNSKPLDVKYVYMTFVAYSKDQVDQKHTF